MPKVRSRTGGVNARVQQTCAADRAWRAARTRNSAPNNALPRAPAPVVPPSQGWQPRSSKPGSNESRMRAGSSFKLRGHTSPAPPRLLGTTAHRP